MNNQMVITQRARFVLEPDAEIQLSTARTVKMLHRNVRHDEKRFIFKLSASLEKEQP